VTVTAIDTTVNLSSAQLAGLRAAGVTAVSRYIAHSTTIGKIIPVSEAARYGPAGMQLVLNWEQRADDLRTLSTAQTAAYAHEAVAMAQVRAYPAGCAIYVSADWDVMASEWPTVAANLRVIRSIYSPARYGLGLYAPWDALTWAKRDGLVDFYWQAGMSTSWSGRRNANAWPGAHLRQRRNAVIAGVECDTNDILIPAFGQAGGGVTHISATGGDVELNTPIPGSGYGSAPKTLDVGLALIDLTKALDPYDTTGWQNETLRNTRAILAGQAADEKRDAVLLGTLQALTAGGTSVDTAAVLARINEVAAAESTTVAALAAQVAELQHKLAAAAAAEAGALAQ
jgi:hypothetical protein